MVHFEPHGFANTISFAFNITSHYQTSTQAFDARKTLTKVASQVAFMKMYLALVLMTKLITRNNITLIASK